MSSYRMSSWREHEFFPAATGESTMTIDGLLLAAMDRLQIDRASLASESPTVMRQLQARCAACQSKGACAGDAGRSSEEGGSDRWHAYCPSSAALAIIGAMQNCGWAGQYLRRGGRDALRC